MLREISSPGPEAACLRVLVTKIALLSSVSVKVADISEPPFSTYLFMIVGI
jgi:hypothetical protein